MTDYVYEDTLRSYDFSKRLAEEIIDDRWDRIAARVDTQGQGIAVIVFNTLGWQRTDVAEVRLGFGEGGVHDVVLVDAVGKSVPVQLDHTELYGDGALKRTRITFVAHDVPALGHAVYRVIPQEAASVPKTPSTAEQRNFIENEDYRATFNLATGEMTSLFD